MGDHGRLLRQRQRPTGQRRYGRTATEWVPDALQSARFGVQSVNATSATMTGEGCWLETGQLCESTRTGIVVNLNEQRDELVIDSGQASRPCATSVTRRA
jgi:hypothetical protein